MIDFIIRNMRFAAQNVRKLGAVRKAMAEHKFKNPCCAWCGRYEKTAVHHIEPVSVAPELAADPENLITLCSKPACHLVVGHLGDFKKHNANVKLTCATVPSKYTV